MSEVQRPKVFRSKATRDKLNNNDSYNEKDYTKKSSSASKGRKSASHNDKKERHKSSKLHHKISSSSSNTVSSSSSDTDTEKEKQRQQKQKRHDHKNHKNSHKHSKPQANVSGKINNVAPSKSTKNVSSPVEDLYSTDTSTISSHISSAYERSLTEVRIASQREKEEKKAKPKSKKSNKLEPINKGLPPVKDNYSESPKREKLGSRQSSLDPPHITYSDIPVEKTPEKKVNKKKKKSSLPDEKPSKKNSSPPKKEKIEPKRDVSSPVETKSRRETTPSPPIRNYASPLPHPPKESSSSSKSDRFIESVIIPQIAEMVHASAELHERSEGEEELSGVSSIEESSDEEEGNATVAHQTEDEKVEFSLKDTKKQVLNYIFLFFYFFMSLVHSS